MAKRKTCKIKRFSYHTGRRSKLMVKTVFDPFIKVVDQTMKLYKGKWDGYDSYDVPEKYYDDAQEEMDRLTFEWAKLREEFPEGDFVDSSVIAYFEHYDKSGW